MAHIGKATVKIVDDGKLKAAIREHLADAWDAGFKAANVGTWCIAHEQNDFCEWGHMNPYRP